MFNSKFGNANSQDHIGNTEGTDDWGKLRALLESENKEDVKTAIGLYRQALSRSILLSNNPNASLVIKSIVKIKKCLALAAIGVKASDIALAKADKRIVSLEKFFLSPDGVKELGLPFSENLNKIVNLASGKMISYRDSVSDITEIIAELTQQLHKANRLLTRAVNLSISAEILSDTEIIILLVRNRVIYLASFLLNLRKREEPIKKIACRITRSLSWYSNQCNQTSHHYE